MSKKQQKKSDQTSAALSLYALAGGWNVVFLLRG